MRVRTYIALVVAFAAGVIPLLAHHSFAAEFDTNQPIKVTGKVSRVEWQNPHVWFYVDVPEAGGKVTTWAFSGGAPGQLMRRGITKKVLPIGATIVVEGFKAKDGSNNASGGRVTFEDGKQVFTAGSEDRLPGEGKGKAK